MKVFFSATAEHNNIGSIAELDFWSLWLETLHTKALCGSVVPFKMKHELLSSKGTLKMTVLMFSSCRLCDQWSVFSCSCYTIKASVSQHFKKQQKKWIAADWRIVKSEQYLLVSVRDNFKTQENGSMLRRENSIFWCNHWKNSEWWQTVNKKYDTLRIVYCDYCDETFMSQLFH